MDVMWELRRGTVSDVLKAVNARRRRDAAYNTIMSVMSRLESKGYLQRERKGRAYTYQPAVEDSYALGVRQARERLLELLDDFGVTAVAVAIQEVAVAEPGLRVALTSRADLPT